MFSLWVAGDSMHVVCTVHAAPWSMIEFAVQQPFPIGAQTAGFAKQQQLLPQNSCTPVLLWHALSEVLCPAGAPPVPAAGTPRVASAASCTSRCALEAAPTACCCARQVGVRELLAAAAH